MRHEEVFLKAKKFLESITPRDSVVMIFNNDADGVSSCVLIKKLLEMRNIKDIFIISQPMPTEKNLIKKVQTTVPTKIIFLDIAIDQQANVLKKLAGICDILIVDHHQITNDMNSDTITHYNPRFGGAKIYQSTSYCAYKLCSAITGMAEWLWIAAVGMIGDYNLNDSQDMVNEIRKKYSITGQLYDSLLGRFADMISAARATKVMSCEEMVELFGKALSPQDFEKLQGAEKLIDAYKKTENEIVSIMADIEKTAEKTGNIILYNIKSEYNLASPISTKLSEKYFNKIVIIYSHAGNKVKISARNQSQKWDVAGLLQRAAHGMKASAGGHAAAAGATLQASDWAVFKERLIELATK